MKLIYLSKKTAATWGLFTLMSLCFLQCIEEIPLETKGNLRLVSIEGQLWNGSGPFEVKVHISGDFSEDQRGIDSTISGAQVFIYGDNGTSTRLYEYFPGQYISRPEQDDFQTCTDVSYHVEVSLPDGNVYRSRPEKLLPVPPVKSIEAETIIKVDRIGATVDINQKYLRHSVVLDMPENIENNYFKWNFWGVYEFRTPDFLSGNTRLCYIADPIDFNRVVLTDGTVQSGEEVLVENIYEVAVGDEYKLKYCFYLYQQSLTREAYDYFTKVEALIERSGSLFEVPPGSFDGNLYNVSNPEERVMGYFYTSSIDTALLSVEVRNYDSLIFDNCPAIELAAERCDKCLFMTEKSLSNNICVF